MVNTSHRRSLLLLLLMVGAAATAGHSVSQEKLKQGLARLPLIFGAPVQYQRKGTESIYEIARRYGVSASAVHNANEGDLLAGDELLLIPAEHIAPLPSAEGVVINLAERNLYLYRNGRPVACYPLAIGMRGWETPTGEFTVVNKRKNPTWFPPEWATEKGPVPPGPNNPLGDRWMGLSAPGYGMHATNAPSSIGRYVSHGCLRMYPEHARALYEKVEVGTPVRIVYQPVAFGYRPQDGIVYMAHYPDPYQLGEVTPDEVRHLLSDYGLADLAEPEAVAAALARPQGTPVPVIGSRIQVKVNGAVLRMALAPVMRGDDWLVPVGPLAAALGARVEMGQAASFVSLSRSGQRIFFSPGDREAVLNGRFVSLDVAPQLAAGYPLVPLRAAATALGASVGWDESTRTVLISDGDIGNLLGRGRTLGGTSASEPGTAGLAGTQTELNPW